MKHRNHQAVITLSDYQRPEKHRNAAEEKIPPQSDRDMDFIETLFRFLGENRHRVIAFIRMKLDPARRKAFIKDLAECGNLREQARCVRRSIGHLKAKDARALIMGLPEMMPEKIDALAFHGETDPAIRLRKFAETFGVSDAESLFCMVFLLMTRDCPAGAVAVCGRAV